MIIVFTFFTLHTVALNNFMMVKYRAQIKIKVMLSRISYMTVRKMMVVEEREEKDSGDDESLGTASKSSEITANANDRR